MIRDTLSRKKNPALTSDHWHVVHARWTGVGPAVPAFERNIVSEHADRKGAVQAARILLGALADEMSGRSRPTRDQVFVRRPNFKSLKAAPRRRTK